MIKNIPAIADISNRERGARPEFSSKEFRKGVTDTRQLPEETNIGIDTRSGRILHYELGTLEQSMAFLRRKGNTFYLVHNVREGDRVKQLHLAKLGERPRITDDVVKQVTKSYPSVDVDWTELRQQVNNSVELYDPKSNQVQKLVSALRTLNLDLADLFPPLLDVAHAPEAGQEIITQLRLLHSTVGVKLDQFDRAPHRGVLRDRKFR